MCFDACIGSWGLRPSNATVGQKRQRDYEGQGANSGLHAHVGHIMCRLPGCPAQRTNSGARHGANKATKTGVNKATKDGANISTHRAISRDRHLGLITGESPTHPPWDASSHMEASRWTVSPVI